MKLEDLNKDNVFKVPDDYFENFPDRMQERIREIKPDKKVRVIRMRTLMNIAAAVAVLVVALIGLTRINKDSASIDQLLSEISTEELVNYLIDSDISTDEFLENLDMSIIASSEEPITDEFMPSESLDEETIDELLDEYEIELEYL